ncbi:MAG: ATP-dependent Clp protease proteolytic subunit, partial [Phycisphaerae bacterium]
VLMAGGQTGKRFLLNNSRILLHQPLISGVLTGPATDLDIEAKEILRLRSRLYNILSQHTGQSPEKIEKDCDRNLWLEPQEAIEYGLVDRILQKAPVIVSEDKKSQDEDTTENP